MRALSQRARGAHRRLPGFRCGGLPTRPKERSAPGDVRRAAPAPGAGHTAGGGRCGPPADRRSAAAAERIAVPARPLGCARRRRSGAERRAAPGGWSGRLDVSAHTSRCRIAPRRTADVAWSLCRGCTFAVRKGRAQLSARPPHRNQSKEYGTLASRSHEVRRAGERRAAAADRASGAHEAGVANRMPASGLPKPLPCPSRSRPSPSRTGGRRTPTSTTCTWWRRRPGPGPGQAADQDVGLRDGRLRRQRCCRRPRRARRSTSSSGRKAVVRQICHAARRAPDAALQRLDLDAPARLRVAAAVRRLRERHHAAGQFKDYHYPNHPGRADALVPRPRRPHHGDQRLHGPRGAVHPARRPPSCALPIPHGQYDVPLIIKDAMFEQNGQLVIDDNSESGIVRRRDPGQRPAVAADAGRAAQVPLPHPQRVDRRARYDLALTPASPLTVDRHRRRPHAASAARRRTFRIGMAERYEVVIDFSKYTPGQSVVLRTLARRTTSTSTPPTSSWRSRSARPDVPRPAEQRGPGTTSTTTERHGPRRRPTRCGPATSRSSATNGHWTINGRPGRTSINSDFTLVVANPRFDDVEIWELENKSRRLVPPGPHPPRRLQDPRPQRQAAGALRARARRTSSTSARTRRSA